VCIFGICKQNFMQLSGKLISILPEIHGEGRNGPWKKQEFIIETEESYPKKICISNWNDRVALSQDLLYKSVKVDVTVESREFNGRWYTDLRAVTMQFEKPPATAGEEGELPDRIADDPDEINEGQPDREGSRAEPEDDLPF